MAGIKQNCLIHEPSSLQRCYITVCGGYRRARQTYFKTTHYHIIAPKPTGECSRRPDTRSCPPETAHAHPRPLMPTRDHSCPPETVDTHLSSGRISGVLTIFSLSNRTKKGTLLKYNKAINNVYTA